MTDSTVANLLHPVPGAPTMAGTCASPRPHRQSTAPMRDLAVLDLAGHPLAARFPGAVALLLSAVADPAGPLVPGRYIDAAGRARLCVIGAGGATYLAGVGSPTGDVHDAVPLARVVAVQVDEDGSAPQIRYFDRRDG